MIDLTNVPSGLKGSADLVVGVHAENDHLLRMFGDRLRSSGRTDPRAHLEGQCRPCG